MKRVPMKTIWIEYLSCPILGSGFKTDYNRGTPEISTYIIIET